MNAVYARGVRVWRDTVKGNRYTNAIDAQATYCLRDTTGGARKLQSHVIRE